MANSMHATVPIRKAPGDSGTYALVFTNLLHGSTIQTVDTLSATAGLTVSSPTINAESFSDNATGVSVPVAHAVQWTMSGGVAAEEYVVTITVTFADGTVRQAFVDVIVQE